MWMVRMAAAGTTGTFNACGPNDAWTFDEMIAACAAAAGPGAATAIPVDEDFLLENHVMGWGELPVWIPETWGMHNMLNLDVSAAVDAGLTFRPLDVVVGDTLAWDRTRRDALTAEDLKAKLANQRAV